MNEKSKVYLKKIVAPLVLLVVVSVIARFSGMFSGMGNMISLSLETVGRIIIALAFIVLLYNVLSMILDSFRKKVGRVGTLATLISSLMRYAIILLAFCWIASIIGVDISTIFASIGIIALILGFGAESLVADLVTGVFILFENEYNIGDIIEVDGFRGTVKSISIRTLSLEDGGGNIKSLITLT